jgi:hypothetical protein
MSQYITEPELAMAEVILQCRDMLAYHNKWWLEILIDAMICRQTEINAT